MVASREIKRGEGESNGRNMRGNGEKKTQKGESERNIKCRERICVGEKCVRVKNAASAPPSKVTASR